MFTLHSAGDFGVVLRGDFHVKDGERLLSLVFVGIDIFSEIFSNFPKKNWMTCLEIRGFHTQLPKGMSKIPFWNSPGVVAGKPTRPNAAADSINLGTLPGHEAEAVKRSGIFRWRSGMKIWESFNFLCFIISARLFKTRWNSQEAKLYPTQKKQACWFIGRILLLRSCSSVRIHDCGPFWESLLANQ